VACVIGGAAGACTSPRPALERDESPVREPDASIRDAAADAGEPDGTSLGTGKPRDAGKDASKAVSELDASEADSGGTKCGDGRVTGSERCDTSIEAGSKGACPTRCEAAKGTCQANVVVGRDCDAHCEPAPITTNVDGDDCCPPGSTAAEDSDCAAVCGNGVTEPGEKCDPPASCPVCPESAACLQVEQKGAPETCDRVCEASAITMCRSNDGCCPSGCNPSNDSDCSARCGDAVIDAATETCEPGTATPCPSSCDDGDPCTKDVTTGSESNCNVACTHVAITAAVNGDGCCWMGANANSDSDCKPACGNGVIENGEECEDGNRDRGDGCSDACKRESPMDRCLAGRETDRCAQCTCDKCAPAATSCRMENGEAGRQCRSLFGCMQRSGCNDISCYCGDDLVSCLLGEPTGPCVSPIQTAAGSNNVLEIITALTLTDDSTTLGAGLTLASCERNQCKDECER
jgi:cysteine-rich repeat protein